MVEGGSAAQGAPPVSSSSNLSAEKGGVATLSSPTLESVSQRLSNFAAPLSAEATPPPPATPPEAAVLDTDEPEVASPDTAGAASPSPEDGEAQEQESASTDSEPEAEPSALTASEKRMVDYVLHDSEYGTYILSKLAGDAAREFLVNVRSNAVQALREQKISDTDFKKVAQRVDRMMKIAEDRSKNTNLSKGVEAVQISEHATPIQKAMAYDVDIMMRSKNLAYLDQRIASLQEYMDKPENADNESAKRMLISLREQSIEGKKVNSRLELDRKIVEVEAEVALNPDNVELKRKMEEINEKKNDEIVKKRILLINKIEAEPDNDVAKQELEKIDTTIVTQMKQEIDQLGVPKIDNQVVAMAAKLAGPMNESTKEGKEFADSLRKDPFSYIIGEFGKATLDPTENKELQDRLVAAGFMGPVETDEQKKAAIKRAKVFGEVILVKDKFDFNSVKWGQVGLGFLAFIQWVNGLIQQAEKESSHA